MLSGWHTLQGYHVYIEQNRVLRGIRKDRNGSDVTAYPFRRVGPSDWTNCAGLTAAAFIAGVRRGSITLK